MYRPLSLAAIAGPADAALALLAFLLLSIWKMPPGLVVVSTALAAQLLSAF